MSRISIPLNAIPQLAKKTSCSRDDIFLCYGAVNVYLIADIVRRLSHWGHGWKEGSTRKAATHNVTKHTCRSDSTRYNDIGLFLKQKMFYESIFRSR